MRHDVERQIKNALKMAEIEESFGIKATYYFRFCKDKSVLEAISKVARLKHEIGYHYEVLDKAKGDFQRAQQMFVEELNYLRKICDINTISMHGNPLTPWLNRDIWKEYDFKNYGILGEAYLSVNFNEVIYLSDTGRSWHPLKYKIKDFPPDKSTLELSGQKIGTLEDIIFLIKKGPMPNIYLNIHPDIWSANIFEWSFKLIYQNIRNIGKIIIVKYARLR
jgi:sporulation protein YlmC with PRC-barrel domain